MIGQNAAFDMYKGYTKIGHIRNQICSNLNCKPNVTYIAKADCPLRHDGRLQNLPVSKEMLTLEMECGWWNRMSSIISDRIMTITYCYVKYMGECVHTLTHIQFYYLLTCVFQGTIHLLNIKL